MYGVSVRTYAYINVVVDQRLQPTDLKIYQTILLSLFYYFTLINKIEFLKSVVYLLYLCTFFHC